MLASLVNRSYSMDRKCRKRDGETHALPEGRDLVDAPHYAPEDLQHPYSHNDPVLNDRLTATQCEMSHCYLLRARG
jgi:hypothetical protein